MKNSSDTIGNRSRYLPVCSAVPQPLRHRVPLCGEMGENYMTRNLKLFNLVLVTQYNYKHVRRMCIAVKINVGIGDCRISAVLLFLRYLLSVFNGAEYAASSTRILEMDEL
jgi:hypothetical protein